MYTHMSLCYLNGWYARIPPRPPQVQAPHRSPQDTLSHPKRQRAGLRPEQRPIWIYNVRGRRVLGVWWAWSGCIVHSRRSITADMALRIGRALGMTPDYWLNLQRMYDLDIARSKTDLSAIVPLVEASV